METKSDGALVRLRIAVRGTVQGVGFRPFIHRLASELGLSGWVINSTHGVMIEVDGERPCLDTFLKRIRSDKPPHSLILTLEHSVVSAAGFTGFEIRHSERTGNPTALVPPDIATCPECLKEIFDPQARRYLYPFTTCTNCGPRFSILETLPCDRENTTMKDFPLCDSCRAEYEDPGDRRFHAQAMACPKCGPTLRLWDPAGGELAVQHEALQRAARELARGAIVAVKGLGGFQLIVDARNDGAVVRLRQRKQREEKPFALMYPALRRVRDDCVCSPLEEKILRSSESPIVLLKRRTGHTTAVAPSVAPANPYLGIMLPYTPLHHILMRELGFPIVATSGNLTDEPICTREHEALDRLRGIADLFLVHNRPVRRHMDDSVVQVVLDGETILRRARGYAPLPVIPRDGGDQPDSASQLPAGVNEEPVAASGPLHPATHRSCLAVGAHLKNTVALLAGEEIFLSQHIGDLETKQSLDAFRNVIADLEMFHAAPPDIVACDLHPDYHSTQYARNTHRTVVSLQHHFAHIASCMAEHRLEGPVLGVSWDGTGYGPDGTVWGGEFLVTDGCSFDRAAHVRTFGLPGGEQAVREPRRSAAGILYELFADQWVKQSDIPSVRAFGSSDLQILQLMLEKRINTPLTSSAGRLFDAVASLTGIRQIANFEGQAAMELEFLGSTEETDEGYPVGLERRTQEDKPVWVLDWSPMFREILHDIRGGVPPSRISVKFHNGLVESTLQVAGHVGIEKVVLSGGCFQNRYLLERTVRELARHGFRPYRHRQVPPNDGGIALGQAYVVQQRLRRHGSVQMKGVEEDIDASLDR